MPVSGLARATQVPVGEYRLHTMFLSLADPNSGRVCHFQFSADKRERPWYAVNKGQTLSLDPIGDLELSCEIEGNKASCTPEDELTVQTWLYTGAGLLINRCYRGTENVVANQPKAKIVLSSADGQSLDNDKCGFA